MYFNPLAAHLYPEAFKRCLRFVFFIFGWAGWRLKECLSDAPYDFFKELSYTCQFFKEAFLLTCQHLIKSFYFYILLKSRDGIDSKSSVVAEDERRFSDFTIAEAFFLFICLMGWNTLVWFVCIWSCSEESQIRVSMNLDKEIRFGF